MKLIFPAKLFIRLLEFLFVLNPDFTFEKLQSLLSPPAAVSINIGL